MFCAGCKYCQLEYTASSYAFIDSMFFFNASFFLSRRNLQKIKVIASYERVIVSSTVQKHIDERFGPGEGQSWAKLNIEKGFCGKFLALNLSIPFSVEFHYNF